MLTIPAIRFRRAGLLPTAVVAVLLGGATLASAQVAPSLGSAESFAVLGGSTVTNTGPSVIGGNLGVSPGSAVTGFPPGVVVGGTIHAANATSLAAQNSLTTAFNALGAQACTQDLTGQDLGGRVLTPGVYCFSSSAQLTGTLTLDAQGNANAVFIFKTGSTLTTASGSSVLVINGGTVCNVFWQIGSSATIGTTTAFAGNILAQASITLTTGASVAGRALARSGAVTLDTNNVSARSCTVVVPPPGCPTLSLAPAALPAGTVGVAYSQVLAASGGTAPYLYTLVLGTLPAGLTLTTAGTLAGTPTTVGSSAVTLRATDAAGCFIDRPYTIGVLAATPPPGCPAVTFGPPTLANATVGTTYAQTLTGSGGTAPYSFTVTAGALPTGISLAPAGSLSGTPTTAGTFNVTIRMTDANGCFADRAFAIPATTPVPALPQAFAALLAMGLTGLGYYRLRRRSRR